jgi:biotin operon repressor
MSLSDLAIELDSSTIALWRHVMALEHVGLATVSRGKRGVSVELAGRFQR